MSISKEFILAEMEQVQAELQKARVFVIQAETSLSVYHMLLAKFDEPTDVEVKAEGTD
jgi:hypothetical protein